MVINFTVQTGERLALQGQSGSNWMSESVVRGAIVVTVSVVVGVVLIIIAIVCFVKCAKKRRSNKKGVVWYAFLRYSLSVPLATTGNCFASDLSANRELTITYFAYEVYFIYSPFMWSWSNNRLVENPRIRGFHLQQPQSQHQPTLLFLDKVLMMKMMTTLMLMLMMMVMTTTILMTTMKAPTTKTRKAMMTTIWLIK